MRLAAELAATRLLSFLLRLAATPCADWHSLSTSAHCLVNVMRRHGFLSHAVSVKHYEAVIFRMFIIVFFPYSLEAGSYHLLTQFMNMGEDFTFPLSRRLLETIDIVAQQRGIHPNGTGELCHVDFLVGQEETL